MLANTVESDSVLMYLFLCNGAIECTATGGSCVWCGNVAKTLTRVCIYFFWTLFTALRLLIKTEPRGWLQHFRALKRQGIRCKMPEFYDLEFNFWSQRLEGSASSTSRWSGWWCFKLGRDQARYRIRISIATKVSDDLRIPTPEFREVQATKRLTPANRCATWSHVVWYKPVLSR